MEVTSPKGFTGPVQIQLLNDIVFKVGGFNNILFVWGCINCNFMILILGCWVASPFLNQLFEVHEVHAPYRTWTPSWPQQDIFRQLHQLQKISKTSSCKPICRVSPQILRKLWSLVGPRPFACWKLPRWAEDHQNQCNPERQKRSRPGFHYVCQLKLWYCLNFQKSKSWDLCVV